MALPEEAARALAEDRTMDAFAAVGWQEPADGVLPLASSLTEAQRELIGRLAERPAPALAGLQMPIPRVRLREWLGLAPPGRLESTVAGQPLWRAVRTAANEDALGEILDAMSVAERLEAFGEVNQYGVERPYGLEPETFFDHRDTALLGSLRGEGREWAPGFAARYLAVPERYRGEEVLWPLFLALVRAGVPIAPEWDALLPLGFGAYLRLTEECIEAIPAERRGRAIVGAIGTSYVAEKGLPLLHRYPSRELAEAILARVEDDRLGRTRILREMKRVAEDHPVVAAVLEEFLRSAPRPVALRCTRVIEPRAVGDLGALALRQLEVAGELHDGAPLSAAERLSTGGEESSFHGLLDVCELSDEEGTPTYDALLYLGDSGTIFRAGTTEVVAQIVQGNLQCPDPSLRDGLEQALASRPPRTPNPRAPRRRRE